MTAPYSLVSTRCLITFCTMCALGIAAQKALSGPPEADHGRDTNLTPPSCQAPLRLYDPGEPCGSHPADWPDCLWLSPLSHGAPRAPDIYPGARTSPVSAGMEARRCIGDLPSAHSLDQAGDSRAFVFVAWMRVYASGLVPTIDNASAMAVDRCGNAVVTGTTTGLRGDTDYLTVKYDGAGSQLWMAQLDGLSGGDDYPTALAIDSLGNIVVTGHTANYQTDCLTVKYNSNGNVEWEAVYASDEWHNFRDEPTDIALDSSGNVYITGRSEGVEYGGASYLTIKYSPLGEERWVARYEDPMGWGYAHATALAVSPIGDVFVTGSSSFSYGGLAMVTVKYDSEGVEQWAVGYCGPNSYSFDAGRDIAIDAPGSVYVTGESLSQTANSEHYDYATVKYTSDGELLWAARYDGAGGGNDYPARLLVDAHGNTVVTGRSTGIGMDYDYVTVKYDSSGRERWAARYSSGEGGDDLALGLGTDSSGTVCVTGTSCAGPDSDFVTVAYDSTGQLQWVARYDGPASSRDVAIGLAVDGNGCVLVAGTDRGLDTHDDYAMVKYSAQGAALWESHYDGPNDSRDTPVDIEVDDTGHVSVAVTSKGPGVNDDFALIRYDEAGSQEWLSRYDGLAQGDDHPAASAIMPRGGLVVTGDTWTGSSWQGGQAYDCLTMAYDAEGGVRWDASYGGPDRGYDHGKRVAVDDMGNVIVAGSSWTDTTCSDYVTLKYDGQGLLLWCNRLTGTDSYSWDGPTALCLDDVGNAIVTGYAEFTGADRDFLTVKYSPSGTEMWRARYNGDGNGNDFATDVAADDSGNAYVTGCARDAAGRRRCVTVKYDSLGAVQWIAHYGGPTDLGCVPVSIVVDNRGSAYVTGYVYMPVWQLDLVTIRYSSEGALEWIRTYSGPDGLNDLATALTLDVAGNVYVTGYANHEWHGTEYSPETVSDIVTIKYDSLGVQQWIATWEVPDGVLAVPVDLSVHGSGGTPDIYVVGSASSRGSSACLTIKYAQTSLGVEDGSTVPADLTLYANSPNPFSGSTGFTYRTGCQTTVTLSIYDVLGREIRTLVQAAQLPGAHSAYWDGRDAEGRRVPAGIYLCRLTAGDLERTRELVALP